jgi:hypothetical protein
MHCCSSDSLRSAPVTRRGTRHPPGTVHHGHATILSARRLVQPAPACRYAQPSACIATGDLMPVIDTINGGQGRSHGLMRRTNLHTRSGARPRGRACHDPMKMTLRLSITTPQDVGWRRARMLASWTRTMSGRVRVAGSGQWTTGLLLQVRSARGVFLLITIAVHMFQ